MEVADIHLKNSSTCEGSVNTDIRVPISAHGEHPVTGQRVLFDDCSDIEFEVKLSNKKDFEYRGKSGEYLSAFVRLSSLKYALVLFNLYCYLYHHLF